MLSRSGPFGPVLTCKSREGDDLRSQLLNAVQNLDGTYEADTLSMDTLDNPSEEKNSIPADPNVRNFSYTVVDGDVYNRGQTIADYDAEEKNSRVAVGIHLDAYYRIMKDMVDRYQ